MDKRWHTWGHNKWKSWWGHIDSNFRILWSVLSVSPEKRMISARLVWRFSARKRVLGRQKYWWILTVNYSDIAQGYVVVPGVSQPSGTLALGSCGLWCKSWSCWHLSPSVTFAIKLLLLLLGPEKQEGISCSCCSCPCASLHLQLLNTSCSLSKFPAWHVHRFETA